MNRAYKSFFAVTFLFLFFAAVCCAKENVEEQKGAKEENAMPTNESDETPEPRALPEPQELSMNLGNAVASRDSVRVFGDRALTERELSTLFWSAQGITHDNIKRAAPSAGALYPLEIFAVAKQGVFHYIPQGHKWKRLSSDDKRASLSSAALGQSSVAEAAAVFVITGVVSRTAIKYGDRAERYVLLEMGHAAQNILLAATAMNLDAVPVGAFHDDQVRRVIGVDDDCLAGYLIPVGPPK